ncbi:TPA: hypothetical protein SJ432_002933 [Yersinia enterocolitica]|nr:hypothetical protein [Yersinia enterocolitica]
MNRTDDPKKQPIPFGVNGPREDIGPTTPTGDNSASYNSGFPPITMLLKAAGGLPPKGQDMNQILYELSSLARWTSAGALNVFDSTFSSSISGYPKGAVLSNSTFTGYWLNTTDANTANPENTDGSLTGWVPAFAYGTTAITGLAAANVTLTALQAANERITLAGVLTANINLIFPAWRKSWTIINNCTGSFSVNCKTPSGTGIAVAAGATSRIIGDGTNIISNESPLITGALQKANNLSEIAAAGSVAQAAAQANIGLTPSKFSGRLLNTQTFTATGTYTATAGTNFVIVEQIGAGGASGAISATASNQNSITCPGSNGVYAKAKFTSGFNGALVSIGAGGQPRLGNGFDGGNTSFGSLLVCPGGTGSLVGNPTIPPGYTSPQSGTVAPTIDASGILLASEYGSYLQPAIMIGLGVASNYASWLVTKFDRRGMGGNGRLNGANGTQQQGVAGNDGYCIVWEYA